MGKSNYNNNNSKGVFSRLSNLYNQFNKSASVYGPLISNALKSPLAKVILGDRADGLATLIDKGINQYLPAINKTINQIVK